MSKEELFEIFDDNGNCIGLSPRHMCHGNPNLLHRTAHVVVCHPDGRLLLQKRSMTKDIQPGKWDTAVGGHLNPGEDWEEAARRELREELGVTENVSLEYLFDMKVRNSFESEDVRVFKAILAGPFQFQQEEIDEIRFWTPAELNNPTAQKIMTPLLRQELALLGEKSK